MIDFLKKNQSVISSDLAEVITNKTGDINTISTLLTDLPPFQFREEWRWDFDQRGVDFYNSRSFMKVVALAL